MMKLKISRIDESMATNDDGTIVDENDQKLEVDGADQDVENGEECIEIIEEDYISGVGHDDAVDDKRDCEIIRPRVMILVYLFCQFE